MSMILTNDQYGRLTDLLERIALDATWFQSELDELITELDQINPFYIEPTESIQYDPMERVRKETARIQKLIDEHEDKKTEKLTLWQNCKRKWFKKL